MKKQISILLCFVFLCILWPVPASAATVGGSYISSQGACVIDYETGDVLYSYNGDTPRVPASMTKIMNLKTRGRFFCLGVKVQALCNLKKQAVGRRMIPSEDRAKESNNG